VSCGKDYPDPDPNIPVVVVDLDSTIAETVWPIRGVIGPPIPEGVELLQHYGSKGYRIEVYTARPHIDKGVIWNWVHQWGLPVDAVHCNKPFGGLYVDDRAFKPEYTNHVKKFTPAEDWLDDEITRMGTT